MSIISKALKKTQEMRNGGFENNSTIKYIFPEQTPQKKSGIKHFWHTQKNKSFVIKIIILGVTMLLAFALLKFFFVPFYSNTTNPQSLQPDINQDIVVQPISQEVPPPIEQDINQDSKAIMPTESVTPQPLSLNGIMFSQSKPSAIINDTIVSEGSHIKGFSILKIYPEKIRVSSSENDEFELDI